MTLYRDARSLPQDAQGGVVLLGNFDGVHRGHQAVIAAGRQIADRDGIRLGALTFEPHPRSLFVPDTAPFRLTALPAKARLLHGHGCDFVVAQTFDRAFAGLEARAFVTEILVAGLAARHVVCGYDFTFGRQRQGHVEALADWGREFGFGVTVVQPVTREGEIYSSTRIREALRGGHVADAAALLGHDWEIEGQVMHGDKRGRLLGFPTANVALGDTLVPQLGVYAVRVAEADAEGAPAWRPGVANLGRRPTVDGEKLSFEVNLFDFSGDLYDRTLRVAFAAFIRPEQKFAGLDALKAQIAADAGAARAILAG